MIRCRVVCGLSETIEILRPHIVFTSDDFPTFGLPTNVMNPERCSDISSGYEVCRVLPGTTRHTLPP
jgi:hypothetical protein